MITGAWVERSGAGERARRGAGYKWSQLGREGRGQATEAQMPLLQAHLEPGVAAVLFDGEGISRGDLEQAKREITRAGRVFAGLDHQSGRGRRRSGSSVPAGATARWRRGNVRITLQEEVGAHVLPGCAGRGRVCV